MSNARYKLLSKPTLACRNLIVKDGASPQRVPFGIPRAHTRKAAGGSVVVGCASGHDMCTIELVGTKKKLFQAHT